MESGCDTGRVGYSTVAKGLRDLRLPRPLPSELEGILLSWGRGPRLTLIEHPSMPVIFLAQAVVGPGIFRGVEALLGRLGQAGMPPSAGVHAIYAVLTYTTGFVAWEIPRTRRQPQAAYAASWRRELASLPPAEFPLASGVLDELGQVASEEQFELQRGRLPGPGASLPATQVLLPMSSSREPPRRRSVLSAEMPRSRPLIGRRDQRLARPPKATEYPRFDWRAVRGQARRDHREPD